MFITMTRKICLLEKKKLMTIYTDTASSFNFA